MRDVYINTLRNFYVTEGKGLQFGVKFEWRHLWMAPFIFKPGRDGKWANSSFNQKYFGHRLVSHCTKVSDEHSAFDIQPFCGHQKQFFIPLWAKRVREVANLTERKNQHARIWCQRICLSVCLSVCGHIMILIYYKSIFALS